MLESLTVQHADRAGKARWVEKTPRHLLMLETLREHWPDCLIIRIVRDPRDVAVSLAGMPFATDSVVANLIRVDHDDRLSRGFVERDSRSLTLRYEDLVVDAAKELRQVCRFIGEAFEPAMLESRSSAGSVAAEHEWWKESVSGPLDTSRSGRWQKEMDKDTQRFAAIHLARYLREHGYAGARIPTSRVAIVPAADGIGARHERVLIELGLRDSAVVRPAPRHFSDLRRHGRLIFFGLKGQLDPSRNWPMSRRLTSAAGLAVLLAERRLRRRPVTWVRRKTLRSRKEHDPYERFTAALLRVLARRIEPEDVPRLVPPDTGGEPSGERSGGPSVG
jgi:hypothetical protein